MATVEDRSRLPLDMRARAVTDAERQRRVEFDSLLPHLLPQLRRTAMRWLRHPEDAEDAVQEAMLSAWRHLAHFDGRSLMSTWLTAILHNAVRMQIRRRARSRMIMIGGRSLGDRSDESQPDLMETLADPGPTPERAVEQHELHELVRKLRGTLPHAQQAALTLQVHGQLSIKEVAQALGISVGTIKAQLSRGRTNLTKRFHAAMRARRTSALVGDPRNNAEQRSAFSNFTVSGKSPWRLIGSGVTF
jgi:RNA polymerase sigma-70 factor, ECF subfamily